MKPRNPYFFREALMRAEWSDLLGGLSPGRAAPNGRGYILNVHLLLYGIGGHEADMVPADGFPLG